MAASLWLLVLVSIITIALFKIIQLVWSLRRISKGLKPIRNALDLPQHWLYGSLHYRLSNTNYFKERALWGSENGVRISQEWSGGFVPAIIIHHPDVWKELINMPKSVDSYSRLEPWLGKGLLISAGKRWARNRKLLTAAFHFETIKPYVQIYNECCDVLVKKWTDCVTSGQPIPIYSDISRMTLDTLLKCSFSYESNCQLEHIHYTDAIRELSLSIAGRVLSVFYRSLPDFVYLNFVPHGRNFKKCYDYVHAFAEKVIAERRQTLSQLQAGDATVNSKDLMARALNKGNRKCLDFIDILLMARDEDGHGLTDIEIRYEVDTFLFEGHDTTAHGLAWTLYCLAGHPEHQQKCREEINEVLGERDHFEYDDLAKLTYTQWCIKESMRLYPPVYSVVRELLEDTMIDGHKIPKGTMIIVSTINIHYNKEFWPDPEVFDPLRFHPDRISKQHPYAYTPFSAGPRNCIGQNFAMHEMRVTIASILCKFKMSLIEGKKVELLPTVLYGFKGELPIEFELL